MTIRLANPRLVAQLQRMTASGAYGDTAVLLADVPTGTYDPYNNPVVTTTETVLACSFTDKPKMETWKDYADIEVVEAEIRFKSPAPTKGNRVKVTGRFDNPDYTDKTFEIIGIQDRGDFGYVCALRAVAV